MEKIKLPKLVNHDFLLSLNLYSLLKDKKSIIFDFSEVENISYNAIIFFEYLQKLKYKKSLDIKFQNLSPEIEKKFKELSIQRIEKTISKYEEEYNKFIKELSPFKRFFYRLGLHFEKFWHTFELNFIFSIYLLYKAFLAFFKKSEVKKGDFYKQVVRLGVDALPIVGMISSLIGVVISAQSLDSLQDFGAGIYVAPLLGVSMLRELGPLVAAIVIIGRSGSSVTAEIATMNIYEEIDAIYTMGIDPIEFVFVPKIWAFTLFAPILTIFATFFGILSGSIIAIFQLNLEPKVYFNTMFEYIFMFDIFFNVSKSFAFGWAIILVSIIEGIKVKGGAEEVGKATTSSVVKAIFVIAILDSIFSIAYFFIPPLYAR